MNEFHQERMTGVGGSDSPVLLGVSPFGRTAFDIWREKMGYGEPTAESAPMKRGKALEPVAAKEYAKATGKRLATGVTFYRHPERPYLIGHIDAQIMTGDAWDGVLEIKIPNVSTYLKYKREGLADYIQIQGQHYLGVTGKSWGSVWIWSPELWEGIRVDVERDNQIIEMIYEKAGEFWKCVESRTPPESTAPAPLPDMPKPDGLIIDMQGFERWSAAARDLRLAHGLKAEAEAIYEAAKLQIIEQMEPYCANQAEGAGLRVYYQEQPGRKTLDMDALIGDLIQARELLAAARGHLPVEFLEAHPDYLERVDRLCGKPCRESSYQKQGKSFRVFRPYFLNHNQIAA